MRKYVVINLEYFLCPPVLPYNELLHYSRNSVQKIIAKHIILLDLIISINPVFHDLHFF